MNQKREVLLIFIMLVIALNFKLSSGALGISPAKEYIVFQPNLELEYTFNVFANGDAKLEMYAKDEFADLVRFDKKSFTGGGSFKVKLKLPARLEKPGPHTLIIGVREALPKGGAVGTSLAVQAPIIVFVPYPGKWAEIAFTANNANVGEDINFHVEVSSLGEEALTAGTTVNIYHGSEQIDGIFLGSQTIESQATAVFEKTVPAIYTPGDYNVTAVVGYETATARQELGLRIGTLSVEITNYSSKILKSGIQPFNMEIASKWNTQLDSIFAEVTIANSTGNYTSFTTPSTGLGPWFATTLSGYLDTGKLALGDYDAIMKLNYAGNYSSTKVGKITIFSEEKKSNVVMIAVIVGIVVIIAVAVILWIKFRKRKDGRKSKFGKK